VNDVWEHTLDVLQKLEAVLRALSPNYDPDTASSLLLGLAVLRLGRYRQQIGDHLGTLLTPDRPLRPLLFMAALYHDIAKPATRTVEEDGRVRFYGHDQAGADMVESRAQVLRLSNGEIGRLKKIVRNHMRPLLLAQSSRLPTRRAIYRFFRESGPAGVDIVLLSLADVLATQGAALPMDAWAGHLEVVRALLEAWWEKPEESIQPPPLLNGDELMQSLSLKPGPQVGQILEAIREAQATGQVSTRQEALELARAFIINSQDQT
jgi:putative nucleotidyltransferase with HDIG domain